MKYEKFLYQLAKLVIEKGTFIDFHATFAKETDGSLFEQIHRIESSLFHIHWDAQHFATYKEILGVPKKFVEQSKKTTVMAIYNEWEKGK